MTRTQSGPPRVWRALLAWSALRLRMPELVDDAAELFDERARVHGVRAARGWYRRQSVSTLLRVFLPRYARAAGERTRKRFSGLALDARLGVRMLAKYPGLSLVSVIGMSVGIALGAGGFGVVYSLVDAPLPLDEGERIVSLQNSDVRMPGSPERRAAYDFLFWRSELRSVMQLSAQQTQRRNLTVPGRGGGNIAVAAMTPSGFQVARVQPLLGRYLQPEDERTGAAPVLVISEEEWRRRFGGDREILGRTVELDTTVFTIVGVMPAGFRFPVDHHYWIPLQLNATQLTAGSGPVIHMFGRLAEGATLAQARAELRTLGERMASSQPQTHEHLRPVVLPYTHAFVGVENAARAWFIRIIQLGLSLLLVVVAVNVAVLVYARTAARTGEIAVRTALGASRRRVITQLFIEALVLTAAASVIGIGIASYGFSVLRDLLSSEEGLFWATFSLSPATVLYVVALALFAAAIVGVVPALKATGRSVHGSLQHLSARAAGMRLGRVWTLLIIAQVAIAVAVLPYALYSSSRLIRSVLAHPLYPQDELVRAALAIDAEAVTETDSTARAAALKQRFASSVTEVKRRLAREPDVAGVVIADRFPGEDPGVYQVEVEGRSERVWTWTNRVDADLFDVFDAHIVMGRRFNASDVRTNSTAVIVDGVFAEQVGGAVVGRRVREWHRSTDGVSPPRPGPWLEVIGVVSTFTSPPPFERSSPRMYHPLALADAGTSVHLAVRARPGVSPVLLAGRVREIIRLVDGSLRTGEVQTAAEAHRLQKKGFFSLTLAIIAVTGSVLLLSAAGIYAMMSFTVASRRREIGIRAALGAAPRRLLAGIFRRAGAQLAAGVFSGLLLAELMVRAIGGGSVLAGEGILLVPAVVALMTLIGFMAALGPARRGLAVQPTEALRNE